MLSYIFPTALMVVAASMLLLKGLKEQGVLGRFFGKVTIRDQPPSNTIQKIVALKEAMATLPKEVALKLLDTTNDSSGGIRGWTCNRLESWQCQSSPCIISSL